MYPPPSWVFQIALLDTFRNSESPVCADKDYFTAALLLSLCESLRGSLKSYYLPSDFHLLLLENVFILPLMPTKRVEKDLFMNRKLGSSQDLMRRFQLLIHAGKREQPHPDGVRREKRPNQPNCILQ